MCDSFLFPKLFSICDKAIKYIILMDKSDKTYTYIKKYLCFYYTVY